MSVALCLLLYAAVVGVAAPRVLPRLTRRDAAPQAAVTAWLVVLASVLGSWIAAAAALAVHVANSWNRPDPLALNACFAALRSAAAGHSGLAAQVVLITSTLLVSGFVVMLAVRIARRLLRARACRHRHARSARIVGRRVAGVDGVVVDAPQKMAYCLGGRRGTIVITSAAVETLDRPHLQAVLAHERAHLAGRHHLLLAATQALAASMPRVRLFTVAHADVARLLEMCADDAAARRHGSAALLSAILALVDADPIPSVALGASTVGVFARVTRLVNPDTAARRVRARLVLASVTGVVMIGPLIAWAAMYALTACGVFTA